VHLKGGGDRINTQKAKYLKRLKSVRGKYLIKTKLS
jgi:hypothetical protein